MVVGSVATGNDGTVGISFTRIPECPQERTLTERINAELSDRISAMPHAWPWMHRRWSA
jgi:lauroyl/myristoyl acyltransferase